MVGENFEICISEMSRKILLVTKKGLILGTLGQFQTIVGRKKPEKPHYFF